MTMRAVRGMKNNVPSLGPGANKQVAVRRPPVPRFPVGIEGYKLRALDVTTWSDIAAHLARGWVSASGVRN